MKTEITIIILLVAGVLVALANMEDKMITDVMGKPLQFNHQTFPASNETYQMLEITSDIGWDSDEENIRELERLANELRRKRKKMTRSTVPD